jgi:hypothetical protein
VVEWNTVMRMDRTRGELLRKELLTAYIYWWWIAYAEHTLSRIDELTRFRSKKFDDLIGGWTLYRIAFTSTIPKH